MNLYEKIIIACMDTNKALGSVWYKNNTKMKTNKKTIWGRSLLDLSNQFGGHCPEKPLLHTHYKWYRNNIVLYRISKLWNHFKVCLTVLYLCRIIVSWMCICVFLRSDPLYPAGRTLPHEVGARRLWLPSKSHIYGVKFEDELHHCCLCFTQTHITHLKSHISPSRSRW